MSEPDRTRTVYVTQDGTGRWLIIDVPRGLIMPPTLSLHNPLVGPVEFFYAQCYKLPVPDEALAVLNAIPPRWMRGEDDFEGPSRENAVARAQDRVADIVPVSLTGPQLERLGDVFGQLWDHDAC